MKAIIQYEAADGRIFCTENECLEYEKLGLICLKIDNILGDFEGMDSVDGKLCDHGIDKFREFKTALVKLVISELKEEEKWAGIDPMDFHPRGITGRVLSDGNSPKEKLLNNLWYRLICIDKNGTEYDQPYLTHGNYI